MEFVVSSICCVGVVTLFWCGDAAVWVPAVTTVLNQISPVSGGVMRNDPGHWVGLL
jgi:hypothetical protein